MKDEQLIFYIAVPGSGWAKLSLLLGCCAKLNLNRSDRREDREEIGKSGDTGCVHHKGAFWDPGMEFGEGFDDLEKIILKNLSRLSVLDHLLRSMIRTI